MYSPTRFSKRVRHAQEKADSSDSQAKPGAVANVLLRGEPSSKVRVQLARDLHDHEQKSHRRERERCRVSRWKAVIDAVKRQVNPTDSREWI